MKIPISLILQFSKESDAKESSQMIGQRNLNCPARMKHKNSSFKIQVDFTRSLTNSSDFCITYLLFSDWNINEIW